MTFLTCIGRNELVLKAPHIPHDYLPGLRIIKTVLAVFICLFVLFLFEYYNPVYAVISCVLMMRTSVDESFKAGIDRTIGTVLGGVIAILNLQFLGALNISVESIWAAFVIAGGVFVALMFTKIFRFSSYVGSMGSVVLLILMISHGHVGDQPITYISIRVIETIFGIFIAVLVNRFFNPSFEWLK